MTRHPEPPSDFPAAAHEPPAASPPTEEAPAQGEALSQARRLWKAFISTPRGIHVVLLVICFSLGFAIATQVIAQREDPYETLSQQDLVVLLEELADREDALRTERNDLARQLAQLEDQATQREAAQAAAEQARTTSQINAALVPVQGPGVRMVIKDADRALKASHFVMAIGELRNAGAEAAELNGVRLTMRSSFSYDNGAIYLDGTKISAPYQWSVIGDPSTIATALEIPGGSASQIRAKGAEVDITQADLLRIDSVAHALNPKWAHAQ